MLSPKLNHHDFSGNFSPIDMETWEHKERYQYYDKKGMPSFHVACNLDISLLKKSALPLSPSLIFILMQVINNIPAFKINLNHEHQLGYFEHIYPAWVYYYHEQLVPKFKDLSSYMKFITHNTQGEDKLSKDMLFHAVGLAPFTKYTDDFKLFYKLYNEANEHIQFKDVYKDMPSNNFFCLSNILWLEHKHFTVNYHYTGIWQFQPLFHAGKIYTHKGKYLLPLSGQFLYCVHSEQDVQILFTQLQAQINLMASKLSL